MGFHGGRSSAPSALTFPPHPPTPRYLLSHGANIAAVNSDGDLPLDLAESDAMEGLLKAEIAYRGRPPGAVGTGRVSCPRILSLCLGFLSCAVEGESSPQYCLGHEASDYIRCLCHRWAQSKSNPLVTPVVTLPLD